MKHLTREDREQKIREYAYRWWEIRQKHGMSGSEKGDWEKAEMMIRAEYIIENPNE